MMRFEDYRTEGFYDEMFTDDGDPRKEASLLFNRIEELPDGDLLMRQKAAEKALLQMGITFSVTGDGKGAERIFPFDIIPRIISAGEWKVLEKGLMQRVYALNCFIADVYGERKIVRDRVVEGELIDTASGYLLPCRGLSPPRGIWCHVTGTDLVRDKDGTFYVLEDNLRCPSGVSYVLENRVVMKRNFSQVFESCRVRPIMEYPGMLLSMLRFLGLEKRDDPSVAVLTPGVYNSAYFEHSFLAQQMGVPLVEGRDLVVSGEQLMMRTTKGLERIDVLYRRINDDFLDPDVFRSDSLLGVRGIIDAYRMGTVAMANAPGTGVADDKAVYTCVPDIIRYYLGEEPILPNVPTYVCGKKNELDHVLDHIDSLVVKSVDESGGYGMLIGPHSTREEREEFSLKVKDNPRKYIAQPVLSLSRVPTLVGDHFEGRHVDLRPFILYGEEIRVIPGGLTRVALKKGSLVVNSSQGGGSKDTWVLDEEGAPRENGYFVKWVSDRA